MNSIALSDTNIWHKHQVCNQVFEKIDNKAWRICFQLLEFRVGAVFSVNRPEGANTGYSSEIYYFSAFHISSFMNFCSKEN